MFPRFARPAVLSLCFFLRLAAFLVLRFFGRASGTTVSSATSILPGGRVEPLIIPARRSSFCYTDIPLASRTNKSRPPFSGSVPVGASIMLIQDVRQLTPVQIFWYWIRERH